MKKRVEGYPNLYKDDVTGVITSNDVGEREKYRRSKHAAVDSLQQKHEINKLKGDIDEIKGLLYQLLNK